MTFWIAAAILAGSTYQANEARKSARKAREVATQEAAAAQTAADAQLLEQQKQTSIAKERLSAETARYAEQKSAMEKEAVRIAGQLEEERRMMGQEESSKMRARIRGGRRALLSEERLNPEMGVLGSGVSYG